MSRVPTSPRSARAKDNRGPASTNNTEQLAPEDELVIATLVEMGFARPVAEIALSSNGYCIEDALTWLEQNDLADQTPALQAPPPVTVAPASTRAMSATTIPSIAALLIANNRSNNASNISSNNSSNNSSSVERQLDPSLPVQDSSNDATVPSSASYLTASASANPITVCLRFDDGKTTRYQFSADDTVSVLFAWAIATQPALSQDSFRLRIPGEDAVVLDESTMSLPLSVAGITDGTLISVVVDKPITRPQPTASYAPPYALRALPHQTYFPGEQYFGSGNYNVILSSSGDQLSDHSGDDSDNDLQANAIDHSLNYEACAMAE